MNYLGIDISKLNFAVVLLLADGSTKSGQFSNNLDGFKKLLNWLGKLCVVGNVHACMEATGKYYEGLAEFLADNLVLVSAVNPASVKHFGKSELQRSKTDLIDAAVIARFCRAQKPAQWSPLPAKLRKLRDQNRYLNSLKVNHTMELNRLASGSLDEHVAESIQRHLEFLKNEIRALESAQKSAINEDLELRCQYELLVSIPGIKHVSATTFLCEINLANFATSRELEVFCGMAPRQFQSGTSVWKHPRTSKVGNAHVRASLYMPAVYAGAHNPHFRKFKNRLKLAGKLGKVINVAIARKLLRLMFAICRTGKPFEADHESRRQLSCA